MKKYILIILIFLSSNVFSEYKEVLSDFESHSVPIINEIIKDIREDIRDNDFSIKDTDDLTEGSTNLYFTDQRAIDAVDTEYLKLDGTNYPTSNISWNGNSILGLDSLFGLSTTNQIELWNAGNIGFYTTSRYSFNGATLDVARYSIESVAKLEGIDDNVNIDLGNDGEIRYSADSFHQFYGNWYLGLDDSGYDWKLFGTNNGDYLDYYILWDDSENTATFSIDKLEFPYVNNWGVNIKNSPILRFGNDNTRIYATETSGTDYSLNFQGNYRIEFWTGAFARGIIWQAGSFYPNTADTDYSVGKSTNYFNYGYLQQIYFNSSCYFDGTVSAGRVDVNGKILAKDKIAFTQTDENEYIDSLADGYLDLGATTAIRGNVPFRGSTSLYRRYFHIPPQKVNPGASGATWVYPDANTTGGWQVTADAQTLILEADIHSDWDGVTDLTVEVYFAVGAAGNPNDTIDLLLTSYYNGVGDTATKTQNQTVPTTTDGTQYKVYKAVFTLDYDAVGAVVDAGDNWSGILNLVTASSEIDNAIILHANFYYNTTHVGIESGDV